MSPFYSYLFYSYVFYSYVFYSDTVYSKVTSFVLYYISDSSFLHSSVFYYFLGGVFYYTIFTFF